MRVFQWLLLLFSVLFILSSCEHTTVSHNDETYINEDTALGENIPQSDILVVYFSHSGNTKIIAEEIKNQLNADIFEIIPNEPYPEAFKEAYELAQQELINDVRPVIANSIDNLDSYKTIYFGYPIWCVEMPRIMLTFLDTYDLSGKTILPFCTSNGSGFGSTVNDIQSLEPGATVKEGISINSSMISDSAAVISEWLQK